jgi:hypothetical protein
VQRLRKRATLVAGLLDRQSEGPIAFRRYTFPPDKPFGIHEGAVDIG